MRESIGGAWIMGFVMFFIVLFSGYLAISLNYTKAFKVKNRIINIIEENEGLNTVAQEKVEEYLDEIGYTTAQIDQNKCNRYDRNSVVQTGGYCLKKVCPTGNNAYYTITSFVKIELPLVWVTFTVPVSGETKTIYRVNDQISC